jgi:LysM repeat protein
VKYFLECEKPFDMSQLNILDGSGLSPDDRVTARSIVHLLDLMTRTDVWDSFYESLPEAAARTGGQHSLRGRMGGTAAALNLRAKTGTINNVSALSGYVTAADGERLAFSIVTNQIPSTSRAKRMEDAIGVRLAQFTRPDETTTDLPVGVATAEGTAGVSDAANADATVASSNSATALGTGDIPTAGSALTAVSLSDAEAAAEIEAALNLLEDAVDATPASAGRASANASGAAPASPARSTPPTSNAASSAPTATASTAPAPRTHKVRSGQTLDGIARQYGTTVAELRRLNPGVEPRRLLVGQSIKVPG